MSTTIMARAAALCVLAIGAMGRERGIKEAVCFVATVNQLLLIERVRNKVY